MKRLQKALVLFGLCLMMGINYCLAQAEVIVGVRPPIPHYVRVEAPSPRHVWIDEDWDLRGGHYVFVGGHWALPPHPGWIWAPGHWDHRPHGEVWRPGHWRRR